MNLVCPECNCWLLDHPNLKNWKKCLGCGYCEDNNGYNKINLKLISKIECSCSTNERCENCKNEKS